MSVHHPETSAAPRNPPSPDSATSDRIAAAIERAERAEAAARDAHLALVEAERFRVHAMTQLRDNGEFVGRAELLRWGDGFGARCRSAIAALKGGEA